MSGRLDSLRLKQLGGGVAVAVSHAVLDTVLLGVATEYRTQVSRNYVQLAEGDLPGRFDGDSLVAATRKYDGEGVFLFYHAGEEPTAFLFNAPSGRVRVGLPGLRAAAARLAAAGVTRGLFVAELYLRPAEALAAGRATHSDVARATFSTDPAEHARRALAVFDVVMLDGVDWRVHAADFAKVWEKIGELFGTDEAALAHRAAGALLPGREVAARFRAEVEAGGEGLVVRRLQRAEIFKLKPWLTVDAVVFGYVEDQFENEYGVASLLLALTAPGGHLREFVRIGSGLTDAERVRLLRELVPLKVEAPLAKTNSDGRPVQFVRPAQIVEVRGESLETERLSGREHATPTYRYADGRYAFVGLHPLPRLTHATLARFREDKDLAAGGARLEQILGAEAAAGFDATVAAPVQPTVRVRRVFTKSAKGAVALRKFLLIETDGAGRYPFAVLFTDVSLGRKDPFQHTLKVANTRADADALLADLLEENVKKGWVEDL